MSIRRFGAKPLLPEDLLRLGAFPSAVMEFLSAAVQARCNVLISGGTGSGKTTLLNCLSRYIPADERVITIEDAAELQLQQPHVVRLETRPPNLEGTRRSLPARPGQNCLRMRPDRIVVGECRSGEALDMLQAMNTGHDGSMTTIHANSTRDAMSRLEVMVVMAGYDIPLPAVRRQIATAIQVAVRPRAWAGENAKSPRSAKSPAWKGTTFRCTTCLPSSRPALTSRAMPPGILWSPVFAPRAWIALRAVGSNSPPNSLSVKTLSVRSENTGRRTWRRWHRRV